MAFLIDPPVDSPQSTLQRRSEAGMIHLVYVARFGILLFEVIVECKV